MKKSKWRITFYTFKGSYTRVCTRTLLSTLNFILKNIIFHEPQIWWFKLQKHKYIK